jgi:hypothetical protein
MMLRTWGEDRFWGVDVSVDDDGTWVEVAGGEADEANLPRVLVSGAVDLRIEVMYRKRGSKWRMLTLRKDEE